MARILRDESGVASVIGVVLLVAVTVLLGATVTVFALDLAETQSEPRANAYIEFDWRYLDDGVALNDSVVITHMSGDVLEREDLEVYIGGELVYNETENSESNVGSGSGVPGLILEVDDNDFNDLNKPCRFKPKDCSPSDPPGHFNGSDPGVVFEWEENVSAGQRLTIQERNNSDSYDVIEPGDTIKVVYRRDGFTSVIAEETIEPEETP
ncbi:type IV pilin [Halovenus salina]|uniref:Type IV pilin n=1 Tax=Halovenus salina TaxID=1510225 RepID=A0ABD5W443_9EURY|nr:type IV pilin [Halovenus salina]